MTGMDRVQRVGRVILHASSSLGQVGYTHLNSGGDWLLAYFVAAWRVMQRERFTPRVSERR
jgi:hypothetical protein